MPPLVPIGLVLIAFAVALSYLLRRFERLDREGAMARARQTLEATGLTLVGDPLGAFTLRGRSSGVDLVLENATDAPRPGRSGESSRVCMVRVDVPLADMVVCRASEVDLTMGPLPSVERARTGHAKFDEQYAVFIGRAQSEYRGGAPSVVGPWGASATLERLMDLGLQWMRVRDGKAEIAVCPLSVEDVARGLAVSANVARASRGEPLVDVRAGFLAPQPWLPVASLALPWGLAIGLGVFAGFVASFVGWFRAINQAAVCGPGGTLLHTESDGSDGGTNHDFHCSNDHDTFLIGVHIVSCMLVMVGLLAVVVLLRAVVRRRSRGASFKDL